MRLYIILQKTIWAFTRQDHFFYFETLHMFVSTFSTLTITSNPPMPKVDVSVFNTFFVVNSPLYSNKRPTNATRSCCIRSFVFLESESSLHFGVGCQKLFSRVWTIMNRMPLCVKVGNTLSITRLHLF